MVPLYHVKKLQCLFYESHSWCYVLQKIEQTASKRPSSQRSAKQVVQGQSAMPDEYAASCKSGLEVGERQKLLRWVTCSMHAAYSVMI